MESVKKTKALGGARQKPKPAQNEFLISERQAEILFGIIKQVHYATIIMSQDGIKSFRRVHRALKNVVSDFNEFSTVGIVLNAME